MVSLATAINASTTQPNSTHEFSTTAGPGLAGTGSEENASFIKHEESDEHVGQKRKRYVTVVENGKKRKMIDQVFSFLSSILISSDTAIPLDIIPP